jgi:hypothetical protein
MTTFCFGPIGLPGHFGRIILGVLLLFYLFIVFKKLVRFSLSILFTSERDIRATRQGQKFRDRAIICRRAILCTPVLSICRHLANERHELMALKSLE